jgi:hypothetical protein
MGLGRSFSRLWRLSSRRRRCHVGASGVCQSYHWLVRSTNLSCWPSIVVWKKLSSRAIMVRWSDHRWIVRAKSLSSIWGINCIKGTFRGWFLFPPPNFSFNAEKLLKHLEPNKVWSEDAPPSPAYTSFDHGLGPLIIFSFIKKNVTG